MLTLPKAQLINQLAHARNYSSYLEICTQWTGFYYKEIEHNRFGLCHRLMYRCPPDFEDGLPIDFRSPDLEIGDALDQIAAHCTGYNLIFVDPYHLYETSLRDISEAFKLLNPGGAIVVHDCLPDSADIATPYAPPEGDAWCGVTYKAFLDFVLSQNLDYLTVDTDYGCGIITKTETPVASHALPPAELVDAWRATGDDFDAAYRLFEQHRSELLRLQDVGTFVQNMWFGAGTGVNGSANRPPLRRTGNLIGHVDEIAQCDDGRIMISGWAFDRNCSSAPVWVYSLSETDMIVETATLGVRSDVSNAFPDHTPRNARFSVMSPPVSPGSDRRFTTLAVNMNGEFAVIGNNAVQTRPVLSE